MNPRHRGSYDRCAGSAMTTVPTAPASRATFTAMTQASERAYSSAGTCASISQVSGTRHDASIGRGRHRSVSRVGRERHPASDPSPRVSSSSVTATDPDDVAEVGIPEHDAAAGNDGVNTFRLPLTPPAAVALNAAFE
jgi:hypothetical protein